MFSQQDRANSINRFSEEIFDVVIVGGGINGAGIARDAASRGLSVALLEAGDFAIGTSSRSSKLIHGGIRYLENLEFKLVFEALAERAVLFEIAPHLVHPLRFIIPIFKSSRVGYYKMAMGMWLYDILSAFDTPELHEGMNAEETVCEVPGINPQELIGSFSYADAYTDDDRLVIETMRSAKNFGAEIANYCRVVGAEWNNQEITSLKFRDEMTGEEGVVRGRQFVSAVGPWTDIFGHEIVAKWQDRLRPTKGVHITFSRQRLPVKSAVVMAVEKRIIFVIPRHEMVIVGTTDTDFKSDPKDVKVDPADVEYLLSALHKYFPNYNLQAADILASYAGVRPLVNDGAATEGKTSREHQFFWEGKNLLFVAGGKYTTYRKIAEEAVIKLLKRLPFAAVAGLKNANTHEPINPLATRAGIDRLLLSTEELAQKFDLPVSLVIKAVERHGEEALAIFKMSKKMEFEEARERYWAAEAQFAIDNTCCLFLQDFYWRRSPLFLSEVDNGKNLIDAIAIVFARNFNWSSSQLKDEIQKLQDKMAVELNWKATFFPVSEVH